MEDDTKRCPFCGEEIKAKAIKCKHCGEFLEAESSENTKDLGVEQAPKSSDRSGCLVVFFVLLLIGIIGAIVSPESNTDNTTSSTEEQTKEVVEQIAPQRVEGVSANGLLQLPTTVDNLRIVNIKV